MESKARTSKEAAERTFFSRKEELKHVRLYQIPVKRCKMQNAEEHPPKDLEYGEPACSNSRALDDFLLVE